MTHFVDLHVGRRIRHRRWMMGMTQQELADRVGIRFQQIQKYETGANRVSASRLWDIASALDVTISFFYEGVGHTVGSDDLRRTQGESREAMELVSHFSAIAEPQRRRLFDLALVLRSAA